MSWELDIKTAEALLGASRIPTSLEIISLIKKVNPTKLCLCDAARDRGYQVKGRLQNLLLENYGEAFYLAPHPYSNEKVLIKHTALSNIDACHADLKELSPKALATVAPSAGSVEPEAAKAQRSKSCPKKSTDLAQPREALRQAQKLLDQYDYLEAEELLAGIRVPPGEQEVLERGVRMLVEELGAYRRAIETLLAQPRQVLRDRRIRELLALAYYQNGAHPEARAIFDSLYPTELGMEALYAYADLSFRDGNLSLAYHIARIAEEARGYLPAFAALQREIRAGLEREAEPLMQRALAELGRGSAGQAAALAREALERCPHHQKAREVLAVVESEKKAAEIAALRERVGQAQGEAKLELLEQLLEGDHERRDQIRELLATEKALLKKKQVKDEMARLHRLAREGAWQGCWPILQWLAGQRDHEEEYREACLLSPNFSVIYRNRRLERLPEKVARELWLDFVRASAQPSEDQQEERFRAMERIKPYFHACPEFSETYQPVLAAQQERVREEIRGVLDEANLDGSTVALIRKAIAAVRKKAPLLPPEEGDEYLRQLDSRLAQLTPEQQRQEEDALLAAYCEAVQFGNVVRAALIRQELRDTPMLAEIDKEYDELYRVESEAIPLSFSNDLPVVAEGEPTVIWRGTTDRHILLWEAHGALVVVNLAELTATRFSAPCFKGLLLCDAIPARDTFLFRASYDKNIFLRAELSRDRAAFTALLDATDSFTLEEGEEVCDLFMSSEKGCDYYLNLAHQDGSKPGRVVRQRANNRNRISYAVRDLDQAQLYCRRLTSEPDRFIIGAEGETRICPKNLLYDLAMEMTPDIWQVDEAAGRIYYFYSTMLKRVDFSFGSYEEFPDTGICFFFTEQHRIMALSPETDTVLLELGRRAALYNYRTNRISKPFEAGSIIGTSPARKWYRFEYCQEPLKLILRDITDDIYDVLQWEDVCPLPFKERRTDELFAEFYKQVYFGYEAQQ